MYPVTLAGKKLYFSALRDMNPRAAPIKCTIWAVPSEVLEKPIISGAIIIAKKM